MQLRRPLMAIPAAVVLGLAACGGDGGSSAKEDITDVVKRGVVGRDVKAKCEETTTESFIQRVYGDVGQCRKAEKSEEADDSPTGVRVSDVRVDGEKATATVLYEGGETDGAKGTFEFRKEDGDWRIDDLGVDLLRSQVVKGLQGGDGATAGLREPKIRSCIRKAFTDLSDEELKRVAYASVSERESSRDDIGRVINPCLTQAGTGKGSGSTSFLREKFEEGIATSLRKNGLSQAAIGCVNERLRSSISDEQIQQTATSSSKTNMELQRKAADAIRACRGK